MPINHLTRTAICVTLTLSLLGCADEQPSSGANAKGLTCGPNATLHQSGSDAGKAHCDCNEGFTLYQDECVAKDSSTFNQDAGSGGDAVDAGSDAGGQGSDNDLKLPASCWKDSTAACDPRGGEGCDVSKGDTCDIAKAQGGGVKLQCFPGSNTQRIGRICDASKGPFCAVGLTCVEAGICKRFCCDKGDCGSAETCKPFALQLGTLGFCDDGKSAPKCVKAWDSCQKNADCCSKQCHSGHCH